MNTAFKNANDIEKSINRDTWTLTIDHAINRLKLNRFVGSISFLYFSSK
jgi:hypothetical protein